MKVIIQNNFHKAHHFNNTLYANAIDTAHNNAFYSKSNDKLK